MAKHKESAEGYAREAINASIQFALAGVIHALLFIGEVLEKHLKDIATNTKRIGNG